MSLSLTTTMTADAITLTYPDGTDAGRIVFANNLWQYIAPRGDEIFPRRHRRTAAEYDALAWAEENQPTA